MLDRHLQINRHFYTKKNCKSIHIKIIGDLHHFKDFEDSKLEKIEKELEQTPTDYICIVGDLIDGTDYLYTNKEKNIHLINWLKRISLQHKTFLTIGNHDMESYKTRKVCKDINKEFFEELRNIPGLLVSHYSPYYEDDFVIIYQLELNYEYYNDKKHENIDILLEILESQKKKMRNLNNEKVKILMVHSPERMTHPKVLEYIKEFDFILAGHMHNGLIPPFLTNILPGNRGIISPYKKPFNQHARGTKTIKTGTKEVPMIITGGITKLQKCAPFHLGKLNCLYSMQMDELIINEQQK